MLLLWVLLGWLGGAAAYRLAERTTRGGSLGAGRWLPHCGCGRAEPPRRWLAAPARLLGLACPGCGAPVGAEPLAAEVAGAALFALLAWRVEDPVQTGLFALATLVLIATTLTDLRERRIPNAITYPACLAALVGAAVPGGVGLVQSGLGGLAGGLVALALLALGVVLYRRADAFGMGDVKLAVFIGLVAGFPRVLWALTLGVIAGGVIGLALVLAGRSTRSTMPYGPALAAGAYLALVLRPA